MLHHLTSRVLKRFFYATAHKNGSIYNSLLMCFSISQRLWLQLFRNRIHATLGNVAPMPNAGYITELVCAAVCPNTSAIRMRVASRSVWCTRTATGPRPVNATSASTHVVACAASGPSAAYRITWRCASARRDTGVIPSRHARQFQSPSRPGSR